MTLRGRRSRCSKRSILDHTVNESGRPDSDGRSQGRRRSHEVPSFNPADPEASYLLPVTSAS